MRISEEQSNKKAGRETAPAVKEMTQTARRTTTSTEVKRRYNEKVYGRIYLQLPKETVEAFKVKCNESGVSQASILLEAIENYLSEK